MKLLITTGVLAISLALTANAASAAVSQTNKSPAVSHVTRAQPSRVAAFGGWGGAQAAPSYTGTGWGVGRTHVARAQSYASGYSQTYAPAYGEWQDARYGANGYAPRSPLGADVSAFIQGMLGGGPVPYANLARNIERMPGARGGSYAEAPTYDTSAPVSGDGGAAAAAAESEAIQQMNDTNAAIASAAAAEAENDEANAATLQTEINAGM
jgi:hypothetical protein